jgi:hypothetical protein
MISKNNEESDLDERERERERERFFDSSTSPTI